MKYLESDVAALRAAIADADHLAADVSQWSIGKHVHHSSLAILSICRALAESTPPAPRSLPSPIAALVLATGKIPRGRGKSPRVAQPQKDVGPEALEELVGQAEEAWRQAGELHPKAWFKHPYFGIMTRDKALRFVSIHTRHHLSIVSDIQDG